MAKPHNNSCKRKSDLDLRNEGISLINNALRAQHMYEPLLDSYFCGDKDKSNINWACYLMQQTIELSIKGLINYYGETFRHGHFVRFNAEALDILSEDHKELREISHVFQELRGGTAVLICTWESISRYKDLIVSKRQIEKVMSILDDLTAFLRRHKYNESL